MNTKLTIDQVDEIVRALRDGELAAEIAARFGVSVRTVYSVGAGDRSSGQRVERRQPKISPGTRNELFAAHVREGRTQRDLAEEAGVALGTLAAAIKEAATVIGCQARAALATKHPLPESVRTLELSEDKLADLASSAPSEHELPKRLIREIRES